MQAERRRFPRYRVEIDVHMRHRGREVALATADVSRHGAYIQFDTPKPERELLQLTFNLPSGASVQAMCMVARAYLPRDNFILGPGMGVDLFAISKGDKNEWDSFVQTLKVRGGITPHFASHGGSTMGGHPGIREFDPSELEGNTESSSEPGNGEASLQEEILDLPADESDVVELDEADEIACFLVRLKNRVELEDFYRTDLLRGGIFLPTPAMTSEGNPVQIILVHPETEGEYIINGKVALVDDDGPVDTHGVGIQFDELIEAELEALRKFIGTPLELVPDTAHNVEAKVVALQEAVANDPYSVGAYISLGRCLLDEIGDGKEAVATLRSAVLCDPTSVLAHRLLERGLRTLGDDARAESHALVAQALEAFLS